MDKDARREERRRSGRSRTQAHRNKVMRRVLHVALDRRLEECMQAGWFGDIALYACVEDGIVQREYRSSSKRVYRM